MINLYFYAIEKVENADRMDKCLSLFLFLFLFLKLNVWITWFIIVLFDDWEFYRNPYNRVRYE
jgi:hypothetical protein